MSTVSTEGKAMQIRVLPDVYSELFELKVDLERERKKSISFNDVLGYLIGKNKGGK